MKIVLAFCSIIVICYGCVSFKEQLKQTGGKNEAIQNAIIDFVNTSKLKRKDSVFSVAVYDTVYSMVAKRIDDRNFQWVGDKPFEKIIAVNILGAGDYQFLLTKEVKVGVKGKLPSRVLKMHGKIFYWWDDTYPLTQEAFDIFKRYHLLQDDQNGVLTIPSNPIDDSRKGVDYYFCRNNLKSYKKVTTNRATGFYPVPDLVCEEFEISTR